MKFAYLFNIKIYVSYHPTVHYISVGDWLKLITPTVNTKLVNNAICHLFKEIRYELNAIEINKCKNVGLTTLMKGWVSHNPTQSSIIENAGWIDVEETQKIIHNAGYFNVSIHDVTSSCFAFTTILR